MPVAVWEQVPAPEAVQVQVAERAAAPGKATGRRAGLGLWCGAVARREARGKVTCQRAGLKLWRGVAPRAAARGRTTCRRGGLVAQVPVPKEVAPQARVQVPVAVREQVQAPWRSGQWPPARRQVAEPVWGCGVAR